MPVITTAGGTNSKEKGSFEERLMCWTLALYVKKHDLDNLVEFGDF